MKSLVKTLTALVLLVGLTACSLNDVSGDGSNDQTARDSRDRTRLERLHAGIIGTFSGEWNHEVNSPIELVFYPQELKIGTNADGTPRLIPELKARLYRFDQLDGAYTYFSAQYTEETGKLILTSEQSPAPQTSGSERQRPLESNESWIHAAAGNITISGTFSNGEYVGYMSVDGKSGSFKVSRNSVEHKSGSQKEINDRIRAQLSPYEGSYSTKVSYGSNGPSGSFTMTVDVRVMDVTTNGRTLPALTGMAKRSDGFDIARELFFAIQLDQSPAQISFYTASDSTFKIKFTGAAEPGKFRGNLNYGSVQDDVEFVRK